MCSCSEISFQLTEPQLYWVNLSLKCCMLLSRGSLWVDQEFNERLHACPKPQWINKVLFSVSSSHDTVRGPSRTILWLSQDWDLTLRLMRLSCRALITWLVLLSSMFGALVTSSHTSVCIVLTLMEYQCESICCSSYLRPAGQSMATALLLVTLSWDPMSILGQISNVGAD